MYRYCNSLLLIVVFILSSILYTSCKSDPCKGLVCLHNGLCYGGNCTCPTGYSGSRCETIATTRIKWINASYTKVYYSINNVDTNTLNAGDSITKTGQYGDTTRINAWTYLADDSGNNLGAFINWNIKDTFPDSSITNVYLNVPTSYCYFSLVNNSTYSIGKVVDSNFAGIQYVQYSNLPASAAIRPIGYYPVDSTTNMLLISSDSTKSWSFSHLGLPNTANQTYLITIN